MTIRRIATATAVAALAVAPIAACGSSSSGSSSGSSGSTINVGIKFDQPGLGLKDGSTYSGFDVEVAKYIAKELGKTPNFVQAVSSQRETLLETGKVDYIVGTYSITDKRKKVIDMAGPYFVAHQDVLVKTGSSITKPEDMNGHTMCSVKGSTSATNFAKKFPGVQLQEYDTYSKCAAAVANGSIDAMTTDNTILAGYASQAQYKGKLSLLNKPFTDEKYGVGLKKGNTDLCTKVIAAVKKMESSGEWAKAFQANLGSAGLSTPAVPEIASSCS